VNISYISTDARKEVGTPVVPPLLKALKVKDKFVHWPATEALGKIGDQAKSMPIWKDIMAGLHRAREWKPLEIVANRLEALQSDQHPLPDPLVLSSARSWWQVLAWLGWGSLAILLRGILGLLVALESKAGDVLGKQLIWLEQQSAGMLVLIIVLAAILAGVWGWIIDAIEKRRSSYRHP
jgi:hypothetical protein